MEKELGFLVSSREVKGLSMGTKELAAIRIQSAFRAYKVCVLLFSFCGSHVHVIRMGPTNSCGFTKDPGYPVLEFRK